MITIDAFLDWIYTTFNNVNTTNNGTHFLVRCLLCGDSLKNIRKKRLNIDWNNGKPIFHCFNCGESGSFYKLFSLLCCLPSDQVRSEYRRLFHDVNSISFNPTTKPINHEESKSYNFILDDCVNEDNPDGLLQSSLIKQLKRFKLDRMIPDRIKLFIAYKGDYKNRIIIPIYKGNDIVYFQARALSSSTVPKYKNPPSSKTIIHNFECFDQDRFIILTEGLIDAFMVGEQGTSMLGKTISDDMLYSLLKQTNKGVILVFDNDEAGQQQLRNFLITNPYSRRLFYFLWSCDLNMVKDLNDYAIKLKSNNLYDKIVNQRSSYFDAMVWLRSEQDADNQTRKGYNQDHRKQLDGRTKEERRKGPLDKTCLFQSNRREDQ